MDVKQITPHFVISNNVVQKPQSLSDLLITSPETVICSLVNNRGTIYWNIWCMLRSFIKMHWQLVFNKHVVPTISSGVLQRSFRTHSDTIERFSAFHEVKSQPIMILGRLLNVDATHKPWISLQ